MHFRGAVPGLCWWCGGWSRESSWDRERGYPDVSGNVGFSEPRFFGLLPSFLSVLTLGGLPMMACGGQCKPWKTSNESQMCIINTQPDGLKSSLAVLETKLRLPRPCQYQETTRPYSRQAVFRGRHLGSCLSPLCVQFPTNLNSLQRCSNQHFQKLYWFSLIFQRYIMIIQFSKKK